MRTRFFILFGGLILLGLGCKSANSQIEKIQDKSNNPILKLAKYELELAPIYSAKKDVIYKYSFIDIEDYSYPIDTTTDTIWVYDPELDEEYKVLATSTTFMRDGIELDILELNKIISILTSTVKIKNNIEDIKILGYNIDIVSNVVESKYFELSDSDINKNVETFLKSADSEDKVCIEYKFDCKTVSYRSLPRIIYTIK